MFVNTAVTDEDWVCELQHRPTKLFTIATVGIIVGTAIFSIFADFYGRKPAFFFAVVIVVVFQLIQIGVVHYYIAYTFVKVRIMRKIPHILLKYDANVFLNICECDS